MFDLAPLAFSRATHGHQNAHGDLYFRGLDYKHCFGACFQPSLRGTQKYFFASPPLLLWSGWDKSGYGRSKLRDSAVLDMSLAHHDETSIHVFLLYQVNWQL